MIWLLLQTGCVSCHADALQDGVHERGGISCVDCHAGDDEHGGDFVARPVLCGDCHADVERMNPYGLPTDQMARYRVSHHGRAFFEEGSTEVATCAACHGAHGILGPADPRSPVHATRIVETCARCHDASEYRRSVHSIVGGPTCATCHDNHGAAPPGVGQVALVCGRCHEREAAAFAASPHAPLVADGMFDTCVTCHGNHAISREGLAACALCHDAAVGAPFAATLTRTRAEFNRVRDAVRAAAREGVFVENEEARLREAHTSVLLLSPALHSLRPEDVAAPARDAAAALGDVEAGLAARRAAHDRRRGWLGGVVVYLGVMAWLFRLKLRSL